MNYLAKNKLVFWLLPLLFSACTQKEKGIPDRPNILLIFTDDQKQNTIHALGNKEIVTPNLDKLADGAFVFKNAYCFGGNTGAVCIPSRNMLMSGKNFFRFEEDIRNLQSKGKETRAIHFANAEWSTIPKTLNDAGYETYYREKSGKYNNPVIQKQFTHYADIDMISALKSGRPGQKIVDDAIDFFSTRDQSKPFFMYLGFPCPHDPRWALKEFRDLYDSTKLSVPENFQPYHQWDIGDMTIRDECLEKWPRTKSAIQRHLLDYYAIISSMDYDIGRLLDELKAKGLDDNTIVIFTSDQGLAIGEHGLMGKQNIYEGTMKVPFLVKGPGIKKGSSDAFIYLHDLFPTFCELANTKIPYELDGISILPILQDKKTALRSSIMLAYKDYQRSVRDKTWKLIHYPQIGKSQLFNLEQDPNETNNLLDNQHYAEQKSIMFKLLEVECVKAGDIIDLYTDTLQEANFKYPTIKLTTPYEAGGLAPDDPTYKK